MFRAVVAAMSCGLLAAGCGPSQSADRGAAVIDLSLPDAAAPGAGTIDGTLEGTPDLGLPPAAVDAELPADAGPPGEPPPRATPPDLAPAPAEPPPDAAPALETGADSLAIAEVARADLVPELAPADTIVVAPDAGESALPLVKVSYAPAPTTVNLSAAGAIDWMHFGYPRGSSVNRKRGAKPLLAMAAIANAELDHYADRPVRFSWSDGDPTLQVNGINDGVNVGGPGRSGFELRAAGNPHRPRVLELFVGGWESTGRMVVRLDGAGTASGAPPYVDASLRAGGGADRVYRIVFQPATAQQVLVVEWTLEATTHPYGNVTLQAAMLAE